ncbi:hypothetical protein GCK72_002399 [Caenorhabditis remanei]|uniref:Uncharacterized protein n=1 Tax=Caenorhabditis remanei TaxID=31234 RepID=A0A6A5HQU3_CAERE|nr:hypothetical protein GCK72_002399 [Caenorhabditis remanei]KAF1770580.1 hypothetical protein GCK72_002399 [Caenorhabditis remanei]
MSDSVKPFAPSPTTTPALSERQPSASSPPQQPSETEEEVRGIVGDEEHYDVERKKENRLEDMKRQIIVFGEEYDNVYQDHFTIEQLNGLCALLKPIVNKMESNQELRNLFFCQKSSMFLVFTMVGETREILDEKSDIFELCEKIMGNWKIHNDTEAMKRNSQDMMRRPRSEYHVQRVLNLLDQADNNTLIGILLDLLDFLTSSQSGIKSLMRHGMFKIVKNYIKKAKKTKTSQRQLFYSSLPEMLLKIEDSDAFEDGLIERLIYSSLEKKPANGTFTYHRSSCFLTSVLELCLAHNQISDAVRGFRLSPQKGSEFALLVFSCAFHVAAQYPDRRINSSILFEMLDGKQYGQKTIMEEMGGMTEYLLIHIINNIGSLRNMFSFRFNRHKKDVLETVDTFVLVLTNRNISNKVLKVEDVELVTIPKHLFVHFDTEEKPTIQMLPLELTSIKGGIVFYKLRMFTTKSIENKIAHAIGYVKEDGTWKKYNSGRKEDIHFDGNEVNNFSIGIFELDD